MSIAEKLTTIAENEQKVFEAGKTKEWSDFWDSYQNKGASRDLSYAFAGNGWTNYNFKPKYDIKPTKAYMMFQQTLIGGDLVEILNSLGVKLDTSKCTQCQYMFTYSYFTRLGEIDMTKATGANNNIFAYCPNLTTIDKLIFSENTNLSTGMFTDCKQLTNLTVEGVIAKDFSVKQSNLLTESSAMSIINALKDYSGTTTSRTLTLHADTKTMLGEAKLAQATQKGWTVA